jgi:hypothetical protein
MDSQSTTMSVDNRISERVSLRTSVTTIARDADGRPIVYKAWTDDISLYGARLLCQQPIEADKICLRVVIPGMKERFLNGKIVRRSVVEPQTFLKQESEMHAYGVEFVGICSPQETAVLSEIIANS